MFNANYAILGAARKLNIISTEQFDMSNIDGLKKDVFQFAPSLEGKIEKISKLQEEKTKEAEICFVKGLTENYVKLSEELTKLEKEVIEEIYNLQFPSN